MPFFIRYLVSQWCKLGDENLALAHHHISNMVVEFYISAPPENYNNILICIPSTSIFKSPYLFITQVFIKL